MMNPMVLSVEAADDLHRCSDVAMGLQQDLVLISGSELWL